MRIAVIAFTYPFRRFTTALKVTSTELWHRLTSRAATPELLTPSCYARVQLVSLVFATCTAIFLTKAHLAFQDLCYEELPPQIYDGNWLASLGRLWLCCAEDFAVGLICLLAALLALKLSAARWYRYTLLGLAYLFAAVAVTYVIANAQIYHIIGRFLNLSLFQLAGGFQPEKSVYEHAPSSVKLLAALVPLATLLVHFAQLRLFPRFWRNATHYLARPVVLILLIGGLLWIAWDTQDRSFGGDTPGDFGRNPHWILVRSLFPHELNFGDLDDSGEADLTDFLPGRPHHTPDLLDKRPTNIILVVLESTSTVYMQNYGAPYPTTPWLCQMQDKCVTFDNFYSTDTHTIASALPLLGSTYNDNISLATVMKYRNFPVPHVGDWLRRQGYKTYLVAAGGKSVWHDYNNIGPVFLGQGFDLARDGYQHWGEGRSNWSFYGEAHLDAAVFADAHRCLQEAKDQGQKFFLVVWNYETHDPYPDGAGPPQWEESHFPRALSLRSKPMDPESPKNQFRRYLRCLWRVDRLMRELYTKLETLGLADDTLVVLTADHGEAWGQHKWLLHGHSLFEEEIHVPLIFISPRLAHLGPRQKVIGSHIDLWATLTDVCGLPFDPRWQGRSLFAADIPPEERRAYFYRGGSLGVRQGKYKYVWEYDKMHEMLYDLEPDPQERRNSERRNIAVDNPDLCKAQRLRLKHWTQYQNRLVKDRLKEVK